jgi:short-subunit dehydrogenase
MDQAIGIFDTNLFGGMRLTRAVLLIIRNQSGTIINIGSLLGLIPSAIPNNLFIDEASDRRLFGVIGS